MNFFSRLITLWTGLWSSLLGKAEMQNQSLVNEGLLQQQKDQLQRLKQATAQLIFQRKRMEGKINLLQSEKTQYNEDLKLAALEDRDELSLQLMEKIDQLAEQEQFLLQQKDKIESDIEKAKTTQAQLSSQIEKNRQKLVLLTHRRQTLTTQKSVREQLDQSSSMIASTENPLSRIQQQIDRLELENEMLSQDENSFDKEVKELREDRQLIQQKTRLIALKSELKGRLLPAAQPATLHKV